MASQGGLWGATGSGGLAPQQIEFFAAEQLVEFIPVVDAPAIPTLSGYLGPFVPGKSIHVPVWLALQMEEKDMGRAVAPLWLRSSQSLSSLITAEKNNPETFCAVPDHYMELTYLFLRSCQNSDRPISQQVLSLVDTLWSIRAEKRRMGIVEAEFVNAWAFKMNNLTMLEANHLRQLAQLALDFNKEAHMVNKAEAPPPELEQLNRKRGNLVQLFGLDNPSRLSQSDVYSDRYSSQSQATRSIGTASNYSSTAESEKLVDSENEVASEDKRPWMGGRDTAPPSNKLRRV